MVVSSMDNIAVLTAIVLLLLAFYQVILSGLFWIRNRVGRYTESEQPVANYPRVSALLALRGADPDLAQGLKQLFQQDYPDYELKIVVDSETDPAWKVVQDIRDETGATHVHVEPLNTRSHRNSLHCASLVQLAEGLDDDREVFVLIDGDVVGHSKFIRELVQPIANQSSTSATGNRWYMPPEGQFGSLVRYSWNAAAMVSMYWNGIPWGGMFAAKTDDLKRSGIVDRWRRALAVDAPIYNRWRDIGGKHQFIPSLIVVNREECSLGSCFTFIVRQLLWTRLYQPTLFWWAIIFHAFLVSIVLLLGTALIISSLALQAWNVLMWSSLGMAGYWLAMGISLCLLENTVRQHSSRRGESTSWIKFPTLVKLLIAVPVTQFVHWLAVLKVIFLRRIDWRGVSYQIRAPFDVQLINERQFAHESNIPMDSRKSL